MALVHLRHPLHGEKVEFNLLIVDLDKANGWVEFDFAPPPAAPVEVVIEDEPEPESELVIEKPKKAKKSESVIPDFLK